MRRGAAICPAVSPPSAWRSAGGWPAPYCSQTPPAETACRCGIPASRRCRSPQPSADTGSAWCGPGRGAKTKLIGSEFKELGGVK